MTGIDAEGFDVSRGEEARRVFFDPPLANAAELRERLVAMAAEGRKQIGHTR
jgi:putative heme iron utilization protein